MYIVNVVYFHVDSSCLSVPGVLSGEVMYSYVNCSEPP